MRDKTEYGKKYYQTHKEQIKERSRKYNQRYYQRPEVKERTRKYRQKPEVKEKKREYKKQWMLDHPEYNRKYYREYRDRELKRHHQYYREHTEQIRERGIERYEEKWKTICEYARKNRQDLRMQIFEKLGNKCVKCGFSDVRVLQIDHVHGNGNKENARASPKFYKKVLTDNNGNYQILCANCNWIKKHENGETPKRRE